MMPNLYGEGRSKWTPTGMNQSYLEMSVAGLAKILISWAGVQR